MQFNKLHHGSDDIFNKFKDTFTFFFIDSPEIASTYGTNVYECSATVNKVFNFVEGTDLEKTRGGFNLAGSSPTIRQFIRDVLHGQSEDDINEALEIYRKNGIGGVSPARLFLGQDHLLVNYVKSLGYDAISFRDETMNGPSSGTFPAIIIFDSNNIKINNVIVYDDYYGDVEATYTIEEWNVKNKGKLFESFIETFKEYDKNLIESILKAYKLLF